MDNDLPGTIRRLCQTPQVVDTVATGLAVRHVAVDDTYVYATDASRGVIRVPKAGGTVETIATPSAAPDAIAIDSANVYWATHDGGSTFEIGLRAKSGGPPATLASSTSGYASIAIDATYVWYARADGEIGRVPIAGGASEPIVTGETAPSSVAVDAANVYWIADGGLVRATRDGASRTPLVVTTAPTAVVHVTITPVELLSSSAGVFVRGTTADGGVVAQLMSDGTMPQVLPAGAFPAVGLDISGNVMTAFGSAMSSASMIGPLDAKNGVIQFVTPGQRNVSAVTSDGSFAYWANAGGELRRIATQ
jgi:hypothetical protein